MTLKRTFLSLIAVFFFLGTFSISYAAEIFVDRNLSGNCTSGNYSIANRNCSGNNGIAYTSIQSAVNAAKAGDTIRIRGGVYSESVSISKQGTASAYITLQPYQGETVRVDGAKSRPASWAGLIHLQNCQYVKIEGLQIYNSKYYGMQSINGRYVTIDRCEVGNTDHGGIVIDGGSNITVTQCDVHHTNSLGGGAAHEAISIVNVDTFEVAGCTVHDNREEGIDVKYGSKNGRIHNNRSYANNGPNIYIDSASFIDVYNNVVYGANKAGIGIAVESVYNTNRNTTHDLKVYNNLTYDNGTGIWFWAEPGSEAFAQFSNISILNNVIHGNNRANWGGLFIQDGEQGNFGSNLVIRNNIFWDNTASGGAGSIRDDIGIIGRFTVDHNLFKQGQPSATYGTGAVQTTDVRFVDMAGRNYKLQAGSPAVNAGSSVLAPAFDFDNAPRSGSIDIGAYEYQQAVADLPGAPSNLHIQ